MSEQKDSKFAVKAGFFLDGTGDAPKDDVYVVVNKGRIETVSKILEESLDVLDAGNYTVMPGLIDSHLHITGFQTDRMVEEGIIRSPGLNLLKAANDIKDLLEAGYTTVRDIGGLPGLSLKVAVETHLTKGPRILAAGKILNQTFGHAEDHYFPIEMFEERSRLGLGFGSLICDGVEECIKAARLTLREGADFIKICSTGGVMSQRDKPEDEQFTVEEIKAIVNEARKVGTFVASHAQGLQGIKNALVAGVKTIEHGIFIDEMAAKMMIERNAIMVPTLAIPHQIVAKGKEVGIAEWGIRKSQEVIKIHTRNTRLAKEWGVKIAMGTDFCGTPLLKFGLNSMELQLLVEECGFTPMEAIVAATKNGAEACNLLNKTGTLEAGKFADLIVIKGNPLEDVKILQDKANIKLVVKEGVTEYNRGL
jgi:imidazolonepropionase-like amidohydrolase